MDLYSARLYGFLCRLTGHREDAEDLVQEVFVRLVRSIAGYVDDGRFESWFFQIALNLARNRVRRAGRSPGMRPLEGGGEDAGEGQSGSSAPAGPLPGPGDRLDPERGPRPKP